MKSAIVTVAAALTLSACNKAGDDYVCWDQRAEQYLEARSRVGLLTGELKGFEATDTNGLHVTIDQDNSRFYECTSRAEVEAQEAAKKRDLEKVCPTVMAQVESDTATLEERVSLAVKKAHCERHVKDEEAG